MPQPKLLRQPSSVLNTAQERYKKKMGSQIKRPARKPKATIWGNAIVKSILTNGLVLGVGVVLTIGVQRMQERRSRTA